MNTRTRTNYQRQADATRARVSLANALAPYVDSRERLAADSGDDERTLCALLHALRELSEYRLEIVQRALVVGARIKRNRSVNR